MKCFLIFVLVMTVCVLSCASSEQVSEVEFTEPITNAFTIPSPFQVHGIGFARLSSYNPNRSFREARQNAITDLESSRLTSVYLEYYGDDGIQSRLRAEYGISDTIQPSEYSVLDSLTIDDWAVYYLADETGLSSFPPRLIAKAQNTNWTQEFFEPQLIDGYWIASGHYPQTRFNPNRGWTKAKQHALKNLSEYLNTKVQALQRSYNDDFSEVHYVTSKHVFNSIGAIDRIMMDKSYHVLIMIRESDVIRIDESISEK